MRRWLFASWLSILAGTALASTPWQQLKEPVPGDANAIGWFSNGCIIGAEPLPLEAPGYQVMRQEKRRYYGHPELLSFISRLTEITYREQLGTVLIGDMGMPAGGRFSSGHASHQSGLDVDIWLQLPSARWSKQQLSKPQPIDLVAGDNRQVREQHWRTAIANLIQYAAQDPHVSRIFVHPAIKKRLCEDTQGERTWLRKVRPWFGHRAHMHVRLYCPLDNSDCEDQPPPPPGDGCGAELESWFIPKRQPTEKSPKKEKVTPPPLPVKCQNLLDEISAVE